VTREKGDLQETADNDDDDHDDDDGGGGGGVGGGGDDDDKTLRSLRSHKAYNSARPAGSRGGIGIGISGGRGLCYDSGAKCPFCGKTDQSETLEHTLISSNDPPHTYYYMVMMIQNTDGHLT